MCRALAFAIFVAALLMPRANGQAADSRQPRARHVFVILLENEGFHETFETGLDVPYLSRELVKQGELLTNFYAIGHNSLDNYIALVSGQAPDPATQKDCFFYSKFRPIDARPDADGQVHGDGCAYPPTVSTIADQLDAKGLTWRGYMEGMDEPCDHPPLSDIPALDLHIHAHDWTHRYATRHNPFVYFHSIIDRPEYCSAHDVALTELDNDLRSVATTPNFVFVTPDLCNDGHDPAGLAHFCEGGHLKSADKFLRGFVPKILASPAFRQDGMLIITFDEAETNDSTACCDEPTGPNVTRPGINGPGGGHIGTLILSKYVKAGSKNSSPYNHYSLLRGLEDIFGLDQHLGYADKAAAFDGVFNQP